MMKKSLVAGYLLILAACQQPTEKVADALLTQEELVKRGSYIVSTSGCNDCHSPKIMTEHGPEPDRNRLLSGHPQDEKTPPITIKDPNWVLFSPGLTSAVGPWGISYAANLTPDDTGLGNWTFEQFEVAIRKGKYKGLEGSRSLLPPMPWQEFKNFTDTDLRAVFAYLQSIKPVKNLVPSPVAPGDLI
jgi:hypothetical protein